MTMEEDFVETILVHGDVPLVVEPVMEAGEGTGCCNEDVRALFYCGRHRQAQSLSPIEC
jgi:hypothetical protein